MRFSLEVRSKFVGQQGAVNNLALLAEEILEGVPYNVALIAPAGHGKTALAQYFLEFLDPGFYNTLSYEASAENFSLDSSKRFHFIDEVHELSSPERIYPFMNSSKHVIVIATNEYGALKEPLVNRCEVIPFVPYTINELGMIAHSVLRDRGFGALPFKFSKSIAEYSRGTPRIAKRLANRVCGYIQHVKFPQTKQEFSDMLNKTLGILEGGFTVSDKLYLDALKRNNGRASLKLLSNLTNIPEKFIQSDIEPFLVSRDLIIISPKGRILKEAQ